MELLIQVVSLMATAATVTWVLANRLADIKTAIDGHIAEDVATHKAQEARIVSLEAARKKRGSK
jgi:hypothetical protein